MVKKTAGSGSRGAQGRPPEPAGASSHELFDALARAADRRRGTSTIRWDEETRRLVYDRGGRTLATMSCTGTPLRTLLATLTLSSGRDDRSRKRTFLAIPRDEQPTARVDAWIDESAREPMSHERLAEDLVEWLAVHGDNAANGWPL